MEIDKKWTVGRVKAVVKKALEKRRKEVSIDDITHSGDGYFAVDLSGPIYSDELSEISRGVRDSTIQITATGIFDIHLFFMPGYDDQNDEC